MSDPVVLSWAALDEFLEWCRAEVPWRDCSGVYGVPRGGLPLAVCLSHYLDLPLLAEPSEGMLWVDDIVDSGKTYAAMRARFPLAEAVAWVSRGRTRCRARIVLNTKQWVVFPWEPLENAKWEEEDYALRRQ